MTAYVRQWLQWLPMGPRGTLTVLSDLFTTLRLGGDIYGGIFPRKIFGGQISSLGVPTKFFRTVLSKPSKFFRRKICPAKNFGVFSAISFISSVFPYRPGENPLNFPTRNLSPAKFVSYETPPLVLSYVAYYWYRYSNVWQCFRMMGSSSGRCGSTNWPPTWRWAIRGEPWRL